MVLSTYYSGNICNKKYCKMLTGCATIIYTRKEESHFMKLLEQENLKFEEDINLQNALEALKLLDVNHNNNDYSEEQVIAARNPYFTIQSYCIKE